MTEENLGDLFRLDSSGKVVKYSKRREKLCRGKVDPCSGESFCPYPGERKLPSFLHRYHIILSVSHELLGSFICQV